MKKTQSNIIFHFFPVLLYEHFRFGLTSSFQHSLHTSRKLHHSPRQQTTSAPACVSIIFHSDAAPHSGNCSRAFYFRSYSALYLVTAPCRLPEKKPQLIPWDIYFSPPSLVPMTFLPLFTLTPSVQWRFFMFILVTIERFYTASETYAGVKTVKFLDINLNSLDSS